MASTVTAATMTVTIAEDITLSGSQQGASNTFTISSVNEIYKRIVTCLAAVDTTVAHFNTQVDVEDSGIDTQDAKYVRVTNLDDTNSINLNLQIDITESATGAADPNETATILLAPGESFVMGTPHDSIAVGESGGSGASVQTTLHDLESILVDPGENAVDVEVFVASA